MNINYLSNIVVPAGFSSMTEALASLFADRPTGVYRDPWGRLIIELRLFKACITRNGETTCYTRHFINNITVLTRLSYHVVLTHLDYATLIDSTATRFTKDAEAVPQGSNELSFR